MKKNIIITVLLFAVVFGGCYMYADNHMSEDEINNVMRYIPFKEKKTIKRDSSKKHTIKKDKKKEAEQSDADNNDNDDIDNDTETQTECSICGGHVGVKEMCECDGTMHHRTCHIDAYTCPSCERYGLNNDPEVYGCPYCGYPYEDYDDNNDDEYDEEDICYYCSDCGSKAYYDDNCYPYCWDCYCKHQEEDYNVDEYEEDNYYDNTTEEPEEYDEEENDTTDDDGEDMFG